MTSKTKYRFSHQGSYQGSHQWCSCEAHQCQGPYKGSYQGPNQGPRHQGSYQGSHQSSPTRAPTRPPTNTLPPRPLPGLPPELAPELPPATKHVSTAVLAPPGFLQWYAMSQMHPVHCPTTAMGASGYAGCLLARAAPLWVFRRENSGFGGWGASQYHL
jgi:hypothetical protein